MTATTTETLNTTMTIALIIEAGLFCLWLIRIRIPVFLCMISAFFWGLSSAWDRLWDVYRESLQRSQEVRNSTSRVSGQ